MACVCLSLSCLPLYLLQIISMGTRQRLLSGARHFFFAYTPDREGERFLACVFAVLFMVLGTSPEDHATYIPNRRMQNI